MTKTAVRTGHRAAFSPVNILQAALDVRLVFADGDEAVTRFSSAHHSVVARVAHSKMILPFVRILYSHPKRRQRHQLKRLGTLKIASRFPPMLKVFNNVPVNRLFRPRFGSSVYPPTLVILLPRLSLAISLPLPLWSDGLAFCLASAALVSPSQSQKS